MIKLYWWRPEKGLQRNYGDELAPFIVKKLTGRPIFRINRPTEGDDIYLVIGSVLHFCSKGNIVWGIGALSPSPFWVIYARLKALKTEIANFVLKGPKSGLPILEPAKFSKSFIRGFPFEKPQKICSVRGPLTRNLLIRMGFNCPKIYGDPALLLPRLFWPRVSKKYILGIIAHHGDLGAKCLAHYRSCTDVLLINISDPVEKVIKNILSCRCIASSSLHGIITADAYKIPSLWIQLRDKQRWKWFKFADYFLSINVRPYRPLQLNRHHFTPQEIVQQTKNYKVCIDRNKLLKACPLPMTDNSRAKPPAKPERMTKAML